MICSSCLSKTIIGAFERDILVNSPRDYNYIIGEGGGNVAKN